MKFFFLILRGMGMGAADVVPGVSGGTIAFITGIYEELVFSIKSINANAIKKLFKEGIASFWKTINGNFLLAVMTGILISVFSLAKLLKILLDNHPELIWSFFFGLIIASAIYIAKQIPKWNAGVVISLIAGTAIAYWITVISPSETTTAWWFIFISGSIAICAMILPGISGSFILLLLGKYAFIIDAVSELKIKVIAVFAVGALVGIIAFSNILSWLLKKYHNITIALLAGFMIGSLNKVWPWKEVTESAIIHGEIRVIADKNVTPARYLEVMGKDPETIFAVTLAIAGFLLIWGIEMLNKKLAKK